MDVAVVAGAVDADELADDPRTAAAAGGEGVDQRAHAAFLASAFVGYVFEDLLDGLVAAQRHARSPSRRCLALRAHLRPLPARLA